MWLGLSVTNMNRGCIGFPKFWSSGLYHHQLNQVSPSQPPSPSFAPNAQPGFFFWISNRLVSQKINVLVEIGGLKYKVYVLTVSEHGLEANCRLKLCFCLQRHLNYQQPKVSSGLSQSKVQLFHSRVLGLQSANVLTKGIGWISCLTCFGNEYQS